MKRTYRIFLILAAISSFSISAIAADTISIGEALDRLENRFQVNLIYSHSAALMHQVSTTALDAENAVAALPLVLAESKLDFRRINEDTWLLFPAKSSIIDTGDAWLTGRVIDAESSLPLPGITVSLVGESRRTTTSSKGVFAFQSVDAGQHTVQLSGGSQQQIQIFNLSTDNQLVDNTVEYDADLIALKNLSVTPGQYTLYDAMQATSLLTRDTIELTPHLADDVFRMTSQLPGVTSSDLSGDLNIRGGSSNEVLVMVDGKEIHEPFHLKNLGNIFSIIDTNNIIFMDLYGGGHPARFGGRMSGVMDIQTLDPLNDETTARVGISFVNSFAQYMHRSGDGDFGALLSARRGYLDIILDFVDSSGEFDPTFYELYGKTIWNINQDHRLSFNWLSASDQVTFEDDGLEEISVGTHSNDNVWLSLDSVLSDQLTQKITLGISQLDNRSKGGLSRTRTDLRSVVDDMEFQDLEIASVWNLDLNNELSVSWGLRYQDLEADYAYLQYSIDSPDFIGSVPAPEDIILTHTSSHSGDEFSGYLSGRWQARDNLVIDAGLHWAKESYTESDRDSWLSPRLSAVWTLANTDKIRFSAGNYNQFQKIYELQVEDGENQFYGAEKLNSISLGYDRTLASGVLMKMEAYTKRYSELRPRYDNLLDSIQLFPEAELDRFKIIGSKAESVGFELTFADNDKEGYDWWASVAWSDTTEEFDGQMVPRAWDQGYSAKLGLTRQLGDWQLTLSSIFHEGWPSSEVIGTAITNQAGNRDIILTVPNLRNQRYNDYLTLNARLSRTWHYSRSSLVAYFEIFNLTDRKNECCIDSLIVRDDGNSVSVTPIFDHWLPIIPSFGIKWEI